MLHNFSINLTHLTTSVSHAYLENVEEGDRFGDILLLSNTSFDSSMLARHARFNEETFSKDVGQKMQNKIMV